MHSFEEKTDRLIRILGSPTSSVSSRQGDIVVNYHYDPSEWAALRSVLPKIRMRLEQAGFTSHLHSFADLMKEMFAEQGGHAIEQMRKAESSGKLSHAQYTQTLEYFLTRTKTNDPLRLDSPIVARLIAMIEEASKVPNSVLLLIDIEMLHPLLRVSAFEQILQGRFTIPTIFFYPGRRGSVGDNPSYLGIYHSDGNYRSTHIY